MGQSKPGSVAGRGKGAAAGRTGGTCSVCKAPSDPEFRPFCSRRCADVDLLRWMRGAYAIPGRDGDADEESAADAADAGENS